jgi:putative transposase
MSSLEGKNNKSGIRWCDDHIEWTGLDLDVIFDLKDKHGIQAHALSQDVKYCRIVKKIIRGKDRWFAQLVLRGTPKIKQMHTIGTESVGMDIGPSTAAVVSDTDAELIPFCPEIEVPARNMRLIQRKMARSLRATNPDNYDKDGKVKPGTKQWVFSARYLALKTELENTQSALAEARKRSHNRLANDILALGTNINIEKLSYAAFQKVFGKSVSKRAPGMFVETLRRKAENAGGKVTEFSARSTKLSQTCLCGSIKKKELKDRWHACPKCGTRAQRDLFSAFLAKYVVNNILDIRRAAEAWPGANLLLERAMSQLQQEAANGRNHPASFGLAQYNNASQRQSRLPVKDGSTAIKIGNRIFVAREIAGTAVRTPCL